YPLEDLPLAEAMLQIQEREPARPGALDRWLRGDVGTVVGKALEKEPARQLTRLDGAWTSSAGSPDPRAPSGQGRGGCLFKAQVPGLLSVRRGEVANVALADRAPGERGRPVSEGGPGQPWRQNWLGSGRATSPPAHQVRLRGSKGAGEQRLQAEVG